LKWPYAELKIYCNFRTLLFITTGLIPFSGELLVLEGIHQPVAQKFETGPKTYYFENLKYLKQIIIKRGTWYIYIYDSKSPIALGISKAKEQRFYCCSAS
jgi:hypothetical protein